MIASYKLAHGCAVCGLMGPPYVLEFHHLDPATKSFELSDFRSDVGLPRLQAEFAKCVVLCSVHHRMVEAGDLVLDP